MNVPALVSLAVTVAVAVVLGLMILETTLLVRNEPPITTYTRSAILRWPGRMIMAAIVVDFVTGALAAHFIWDATCG